MKKVLLSTLISAVLMLGLVAAAVAATPNPSPASPGYMVLPLQISKQWTTSTTAVVKFKAPFPCVLINVYATARASGGTTPTLTVDLKEGATSKLSTPINITAGTVSEGTLTATTRIADESVLSVDLAIGGTTPTWDDITVLVVLKRL